MVESLSERQIGMFKTRIYMIFISASGYGIVEQHNSLLRKERNSFTTSERKMIFNGWETLTREREAKN